MSIAVLDLKIIDLKKEYERLDDRFAEIEAEIEYLEDEREDLGSEMNQVEKEIKILKKELLTKQINSLNIETDDKFTIDFIKHLSSATEKIR